MVAVLPLLLSLLAGQGDSPLPSDVVEQAFQELEGRLRDHPFFSRVDTVRHEGKGPFVYLIQKPDKGDPKYADRVVRFYDAWLIELERVFREEYAEPLGLERRLPVYFVAVLSSRGAYNDYADATKLTGLYGTRAHYDPELQLAITHANPFRPEPRAFERRAALHEAVHAFLHAYSTTGENPRSVFLQEGLAEYLSFHRGVLPGSLRVHDLDSDAFEAVLSIAGQPDLARTCLPPIEELVSLESYGQALNHFRRRASAFQGPLPPDDLGLRSLYAQASLWMHYLHQGDGKRHAERTRRFLGAVERGEDPLVALRGAFDGSSLANLDLSFRSWVNERIRKDIGSRAAGRQLPENAEALPHWRRATPASVPAEPLPPPPVALAPDLGSPGVRLALGLALARRGRFSEAARLLREGTADASGEDASRISRELERLDAMIALRRRFLEHLPTVPKKLELHLDEGRLLAAVERVDHERVYLGKNRLKIQSLELDSIDALELVDRMRSHRSRFPKHWLFAYPYVLNGHERWKKLLADDDAGARSLRADAERDYLPRLRMASAVETLVELARLPSEGPVEASVFETIRALVRDAGELPLVEERMEALRALARRALESRFATEGLGEVLAGTFQELGDGSVRVTYEFDEEAELRDFEDGAYLTEILEGLGAKRSTARRVENGALHATGYLFLRHRLGFRDSLTLDVRFRTLQPQGAYDPRSILLFGVLDDGLGNMVLVERNGSLRLIDPSNDSFRFVEGSESSFYFDKLYVVRARFEDGEIRSTYNGREVGRLRTGARTGGGVFLWSWSDAPLEVDRLVLEGRVDPDSLVELRTDWIAARLAEAGLARE